MCGWLYIYHLWCDYKNEKYEGTNDCDDDDDKIKNEQQNQKKRERKKAHSSNTHTNMYNSE